MLNKIKKKKGKKLTEGNHFFIQNLEQKRNYNGNCKSGQNLRSDICDIQFAGNRAFEAPLRAVLTQRAVVRFL